MDPNYGPGERRALARRLAEGRPTCPRCEGPVALTPVPNRADVPYVRDRVAVTCPRCRATTVIDRPRADPSPGSRP